MEQYIHLYFWSKKERDERRAILSILLAYFDSRRNPNHICEKIHVKEDWVHFDIQKPSGFPNSCINNVSYDISFKIREILLSLS